MFSSRYRSDGRESYRDASRRPAVADVHAGTAHCVSAVVPYQKGACATAEAQSEKNSDPKRATPR